LKKVQQKMIHHKPK